MQESIHQHSILLDQRKNLTVNGVASVVAFSEMRIVLALEKGEKLQIIGTDLKISGFSKTSGAFTAEGTISSISYNGKSFASKLFK